MKIAAWPVRRERDELYFIVFVVVDSVRAAKTLVDLLHAKFTTDFVIGLIVVIVVVHRSADLLHKVGAQTSTTLCQNIAAKPTVLNRVYSERVLNGFAVSVILRQNDFTEKLTVAGSAPLVLYTNCVQTVSFFEYTSAIIEIAGMRCVSYLYVYRIHIPVYYKKIVFQLFILYYNYRNNVDKFQLLCFFFN